MLDLSGAWPVQRSAPILGHCYVLLLRPSPIPALSISSALLLLFILVAKSTHAPRHSSRRLVLNRSASRLALGLVKRSAASGLGCRHSASGTPRPASAARGCKALSRSQHVCMFCIYVWALACLFCAQAVSEAQLLWRSAARGSRRCPVVPRSPRCLIPPALNRVGIQPGCTRPLWSSGTPATGQVFSHSGR